MKVLVIGGGGREHALAWAFSKSATVFCAPGNPGTARLATNILLDPADQPAVLEAVKINRIDLTVVGPEAPLAAGLVDCLQAHGHHAFGPSAAAARIEASKRYAKEIMNRAGVPTAGSRTFTDPDAARKYIEAHPEPLVVKASGLAGGKGAVVCPTRSRALEAARELLGGRFGAAGSEVLVEEFMEGEELSVFALTDGDRFTLLPASQDHKRLLEGDEGPNTGGMGAYTPVSIATEELYGRVGSEIIAPTLRGLADDGAPYRGVLYAGLMIGPSGAPRVVEFNCRFGDPEAEVVLPTLDESILEHCDAIASGDAWRPEHGCIPGSQAAVTTVLAARGYPDAPVKGTPIGIPEELPPDTLLFHAGTRLDESGRHVTSGGRVLNAVGLGPDVAAAARKSRELANAIEFEGKQFRPDIAWREVARAGVA